MTITSTDFAEGGLIPVENTCDGEDRSPSLSWSGVPAGTKTFALLCTDPDAPAGTWTHWVIYDIPPSTTSLGAGMPADARLPDGALQGRNDFKRTGYGGPCPPPGKPHRYMFRILALDTSLGDTSKAGTADRTAIEQLVTGHILGESTLTGRYGRK